jgi:hypothetical protein
MTEDLDELSYDYEDEGMLVRKEIDRAVLSKGAWATVMFLYQELDRKTEQFRGTKVAIVRFKKVRGMYRKQASFNLSNERQARQVVDVIERWYGPRPPAKAGEAAVDDDEAAAGLEADDGEG